MRRRPLPGTVQHAHDLNGVASDPIHNNVIRVDDHFPGTFHPPQSVQLRIRGQFGDSLIDRIAEFDGGQRIVVCDVVNNGVPVGLG